MNISPTIVLPNNILYGGEVPPSVCQGYGSIAKFALERFKSSGDNVILIDAISKEEITGNQFYDRIIETAKCLQALQVKKGDVVGLCSENKIEFAVVVFAALCLNAIVSPCNITYTERELNHAFNLSKPKIIFASPAVLDKIIKVSKKNSCIKRIIVFGEKSPSRSYQTLRDTIKSTKKNHSKDFVVESVDIDKTVALILCSSGTTGLPKGVQLSQKNVMTCIDRQFDNVALLEGVTMMTIIPWFHAFGLLTLILTTIIGNPFVFLSKFEEHLFLKSIQDYKVNMAFMVPPLMVFLAKHPAVDNYDLSSLMMLLCGAAPLSKETEDAVKARIGVPMIRQGYGLSETTLAVLGQKEDTNKAGGVGTLQLGVYGKVVDVETGKNLGPNQRGELCFKGNVIMKGYVNDASATDSIIDSEGWLHTGDIGYYDEDYEFFIVDRIKELIKYKAYQVPPAELEALLLTNPKIKDAGVVGLPEEASGELPFAFVVKQPGTSITEHEVIEFVAERVSNAKRLRGGVRFVDEIPRNPSGKILRRVLKEMLTKTPKSKL